MMIDALRRIGQTFRSIVDLGCGDGAVLRRFAPSVEAELAVGIDLDAPDEDGEITLRRADLFAFAPTEPFELVISNQVFEHIYEPLLPAYVDVLKACCAPGGVILLGAPPNRWRALNLARLLTLRRPRMMQTNPGVPLSEHLGHHRECSYRELLQFLRAHFDARSWRIEIVRTRPPNQGSRTKWLMRLAIYVLLWPVWRVLFVSASRVRSPSPTA